MPFDLNALERGYGETDVDWNGHSITVRYRADLNNRAMIAIGDVMIGVTALDGVTKFPRVKSIIEELLKVMLPLDHEYGDGWDLTNNGEPVPITYESLLDLPPGLPASILGAILRDINDPNRRRPSRNGSSRVAASEPTPSPSTSELSSPLNGHTSLPGPSPVLTTPPVGHVGVIG